ncbi:MAG: hypothetical protein Q9212_005804 [Teloschistes hypoglaucus]
MASLRRRKIAEGGRAIITAVMVASGNHDPDQESGNEIEIDGGIAASQEIGLHGAIRMETAVVPQIEMGGDDRMGIGKGGTAQRVKRDIAQFERKLTYRTKDDPPARRPDRHRDRSRSRSPRRNEKPAVRTRSPPRGPSSRQPPSGPNKPTRSSRSPPPAKLPPTGPRNDTASQPQTNGAKPSAASARPQATEPGSKMDIDEDSDPETTMMRRMMGFANFKSTKNTKVPGNNVYAVRKEKKTEYRQYMNRVGGFNRPLSPSR